jgi:hypothetical protein
MYFQNSCILISIALTTQNISLCLANTPDDIILSMLVPLPCQTQFHFHMTLIFVTHQKYDRKLFQSHPILPHRSRRGPLISPFKRCYEFNKLNHTSLTSPGATLIYMNCTQSDEFKSFWHFICYFETMYISFDVSSRVTPFAFAFQTISFPPFNDMYIIICLYVWHEDHHYTDVHAAV